MKQKALFGPTEGRKNGYLSQATLAGREKGRIFWHNALIFNISSIFFFPRANYISLFFFLYFLPEFRKKHICGFKLLL